MPKNCQKSGENMGFDTRGSMPVTCPFTCSKKRNAPKRCVFLFGRLTPPKGFDFLAQGAVFLALGHRSREAYALTHLAPKKRYQRFS